MDDWKFCANLGTKIIEIGWIKGLKWRFFDEKALFLKKNAEKVCQFRKKHYLCIRIQGNAPDKG